MIFGSKKIEAGVGRTRGAWFNRIAGLFVQKGIDPSLWEDLEELLLGADVGVAMTARLVDQLKSRVSQEDLREPDRVREVLQEEMISLLAPSNPGRPLLDGDGSKIILIVGVNGVGKTTTIAKLGHYLRQRGKSVLFAAADTFRAAAIDQLRIWATRVGVDVVASQPGGDPGAVVFDAFQAALRRGIAFVIVDTAGRLHTKFNLMEEVKKIKRVLGKIDPQAPHEVFLVLDATIGQNSIAQARSFTEAVGITGIVLAKLDGSAKGGALFPIVQELKIPIRFLGVGEKIDDLIEFDSREFVKALFS